MRRVTSFEDIKEYLTIWFPLWAALEENGELIVDWCCRFRLNDGKFFFTETPNMTHEQVKEFKETALMMWRKEMRDFPEYLNEEGIKNETK